MATATNPRDFIQKVTIDDATWTEITVGNPCRYVTVRQIAVETQVPIFVKHRSDGAEDVEDILAAERWEKAREFASSQPSAKKFQPGDTVGFFQRASGIGNINLIVREHEV